ncbi:glycosyltransferase family 2 protein [Bacteroides eggerthii]|uniref:glycosyltransferase family 2 protein n=1 Tax=Bacteroides eggerthii TaxID=28111 RepID=UPI001C37D627|nr:glycosyltransferase [Bacteroides eggerthii]MBV4018637.1 glycosyltransferase [Bacteroides eggerthii]
MVPILSIIIPCYNSGKFIGSTVEMLLRQDLSGCELILVNDGSTDDTLLILQKYESAENNIFVIDQPNRGVSAARNTGMLAAHGRYIYFLDSDDTLTDGTLPHFKQVVSEHPDCQMFAFGYETRRDGVKCKSYVTPGFDKQTFSGDILQKSFLKKKLFCHICSCMYGRMFLLDNQLHFKQGLRIGEDVLFLLQVMFKVNKAYYSERLCFIYQIRNDSTMQGYKSYNSEYYQSQIELQNFLSPIAVTDKSIRKCINFFLLFSYTSNLWRYLCSNYKDKNLNAQFVRDKNIRYKANFVGNFTYWLVMKVMMFLPVRLTLLLLK